MPITISGSNGITFNDGTTQNSAGLRVINVTRKIWHTRFAPGTFTTKQFPEGWQNILDFDINVNRLHPNSVLLVKWTMSMRTNASDCLIWRASWGGHGWYQGTMPYDAGFGCNSKPFYTTMWMDSLPNGERGSKRMLLEYSCNNGDTNNRPASVINPNNRNDDNRYTQEYSSCVVFELAR